MVVQHAALLVTSLLLVVLAYHSNGEEYTHTWAVQIEGGEDVARAVADKHGFQYVSQVCIQTLSLNPFTTEARFYVLNAIAFST